MKTIKSITISLFIFLFSFNLLAQTPDEADLIRSNLGLLTASLADVCQNDQVKALLYQAAFRCTDDYHFIYIDELITAARNVQLELLPMMNQTLCQNHSMGCDNDAVTGLLENLRYGDINYRAQIAIPHFKTFTSTQLMEDNPQLAFTFLADETYPMSCINCDDGLLQKEDEVNSVAWVILTNPDWRIFINPTGNQTVYISNCSATLISNNFDDQCASCPGSMPKGGIPHTGGSGGMSHEIQINLITDGDQVSIHDCLYITPNGANPAGSDNYATVRTLPGFTYYTTSYTAPNLMQLHKLVHGIIDREHSYNGGWIPLEGDVLTLCTDETRFNNWFEFTERYALGSGGIFEISRPITQQKLYFAFPTTPGLWYSQGPDMWLEYESHLTGQFCSPLPRKELEEDYHTSVCLFCIHGSANLGIPQSQITEYLATTDLNFISNYWSDNVITVLFQYGLLSSPSNNVHVFNAVMNPIPDSPAGTLVGQLLHNSDNSYDFQNEFIGGISFPVNSVLTIHVRARFANGEEIDEIRQVTLQTPQFGSGPFNIITTEIRGNINDYNSGIVNYQIDIYQ